ncbi:hypothetical protein SVI_1725 [Shewanella violacea DSS12]|uniref:Uncharacterized protein n=1 Tax=Shewanella violacea (strain JCM 10179 / CIP 106290 / LMG 19151 / DSS12) TaxID=637905 RepID=D4ZJ47_SHEVD|nr:hypothetical protein SVI_1725 [Shewanella violacea DSS12]
MPNNNHRNTQTLRRNKNAALPNKEDQRLTIQGRMPANFKQNATIKSGVILRYKYPAYVIALLLRHMKVYKLKFHQQQE